MNYYSTWGQKKNDWWMERNKDRAETSIKSPCNPNAGQSFPIFFIAFLQSNAKNFNLNLTKLTLETACTHPTFLRGKRNYMSFLLDSFLK